MGDGNEPEIFMDNYHKTLDHWLADTHGRISKPMIADSTFTKVTEHECWHLPG